MTKEEVLRKYQIFALEAGRERVSEQTLFLHHHYHLEGAAQAIPLFENFLFAYTLLKNRSAESIQEGKELLEKLLHFHPLQEGVSKGNFPLYLHEYPFCGDPLQSTQMLPVLYWILEQFGSVLGASLCEKIAGAARCALSHALTVAGESFFSYRHKLKLSSSLIAFGRLFNDRDLENKGDELLKKGALETTHSDWFSPGRLGDILLSLQLNHSSLADSPWRDLWNHLCITYDFSTSLYCGPCLQNYYWKGLPQLTLYDYFMASFRGVIPDRLSQDSILQLHAGLIQADSNQLPDIVSTGLFTGSVEGKQWSVYSEPSFSVSTLEHVGNKQDCLWKGIIPMQLLLGDSEEVISIAAQGGNYRELKTQIEFPGIQLDYELSECVDVDDKEEKREVILSVTKGEQVKIFVNHARSNTFKCGDVVEVNFKHQKISLTFEILEGEGRFIGHIMPGNRASQLALKNGNRFNAYDWQLFLRTLARTDSCRIRVTITVLRA